jgi:site-specific DNA-methyltransferase (adenine-specific)
MTPFYQDDWCTIFHGDCRNILPTLGKVDLIVTDPPYSISLEGSSGAHTSKKGGGTHRKAFFDGDTDWQTMTTDVVERLLMAVTTTQAASLYAWCGHRQFGPIVEMLEQQGMKTRPIVWQKQCPVPAPPGVGWDSAVELCVYAFKPGRVWTPPTGTKVPNFIVADSYRHGQPGKVDHPTQKPMATATLLIERSSEPGQTVLDPYMGSGTTLRAAKDLGRKAIGIELNEKYCEIAVARLAQEVLDFR